MSLATALINDGSVLFFPRGQLNCSPHVLGGMRPEEFARNGGCVYCYLFCFREVLWSAPGDRVSKQTHTHTTEERVESHCVEVTCWSISPISWGSADTSDGVELNVEPHLCWPQTIHTLFWVWMFRKWVKGLWQWTAHFDSWIKTWIYFGFNTLPTITPF